MIFFAAQRDVLGNRKNRIKFNARVKMTEKENSFIKELGLDTNPSVSLSVCGSSAPLKESSDSEVISSDELQSLIAFFEKAQKVSSKSLSFTINQMPDISTLWVDELGEGLAQSTSLNSLTLAVNNCSKTNSIWGRELGEGLVPSIALNSVCYEDQSYF